MANIKEKLGKENGLASLASQGLNPEQASMLSGAIGGLGAGGPVEFKLPTISSGTFDVGGLMSQSKALLGNDKIPALNFGNIKPLSQADTTAYNNLKANADKEEDNWYAARKEFWDARSKYGPDSSEAQIAEQKYKDSGKKLESIKADMAKISMSAVS